MRTSISIRNCCIVGVAQLPLAFSGKLFTTMKKALFHERLLFFGVKMNTSVLPTEPCHHAFDVPTTRDSLIGLFA